jgi:hypothetical protein
MRTMKPILAAEAVKVKMKGTDLPGEVRLTQ